MKRSGVDPVVKVESRYPFAVWKAAEAEGLLTCIFLGCVVLEK